MTRRFHKLALNRFISSRTDIASDTGFGNAILLILSNLGGN